MAGKGRSYSKSLKGFVSFLSFSGNGHSLISSLIDAHKDAIVSRERMILSRIYSGELKKEQALQEIANASKSYTSKGRPHKGSNTNHVVPNQFNGSSDSALIMGDKSGGGTISAIYSNKDFVEKVSNILGVPLYFIHIYRDPFNVVSHTRKFYPKYPTKNVISRVSSRYLKASESAKLIDGSANVLSISFDCFVDSPVKYLTLILNFLGLPIYENFISDCSSIIQPTLLNERDDIVWTNDNILAVESLYNKFPYLRLSNNLTDYGRSTD